MSKGPGATEELTASVGEIGRQVEQSTEIARAAVEQADRTSTTVEGLAPRGAAHRQRGETHSGYGVADQLARAQRDDRGGARREGGEGFAVVASEVKSLATQTAKATEDIATQISTIRQATGETVAAIHGIGGTIGQINEIAATIAAAVEKQLTATFPATCAGGAGDRYDFEQHHQRHLGGRQHRHGGDANAGLLGEIVEPDRAFAQRSRSLPELPTRRLTVRDGRRVETPFRQREPSY
jgi:hypothetical protein